MHSVRALSFLQCQIDHIAVPVFVADEEDDLRIRFVAVNSQYARLCGVSKEDMIGREPFAGISDPATAAAIARKYRMCLAGDEPVCFRDRLSDGETVVVVETTLQKVALSHANGRRIVGTCLEIGGQQAECVDIGFYMSLVRNSLTTIEMLMELGREGAALSVSEREATEVLARKALAALDDVERAAERLMQNEKARQASTAGTLRRMLLH